MKSCTTGSMRLEMSRPRSMFSRMRVELMSSRWVGSCSWMTWPVNAAEVRVDLVALRVAGAAKDDVVQGVDGAGRRRRPVGGGVGHHVGAHRQVQLPAGKDLPQPVQVLRRGQVHRDVVGEEVHVELVRHGHADDLPPHQGGLGLLGPGELVDGQVHLQPQVPDLLDDALVAQGEGVEGAGEEGHPVRAEKGKWPLSI